MKKVIYSLMLSSFIFACDSKNTRETEEELPADTTTVEKKDDYANATLEKAWETDTIMTTSESVLYDKERDVLYISNISGNPTDKDGNGFISTIDMNGNIKEAKFVSGFLDAPKGMGIKGNKLYVTNIDQLVEIDLDSKKASKTWKIDTAKFLNDIVVSEDGTIYFSDSEGNAIYSLKDGKIEAFLHDEKLNGPNGLLIKDSTMMVASMHGSTFYSVNMSDKKINEVATEIGAGDGVVAVNDSTYLVSSWNGEVFMIGDNGNKRSLINTQGDKINSADIEFIKEKYLLLVPTFFDNRVVAYKLNLSDSVRSQSVN